MPGDTVSLPFRAGSSSAVAAIMLHIDMPDYRAVLGEIRRVLVPGGVFVHVGFTLASTELSWTAPLVLTLIIKPGYLALGDCAWSASEPCGGLILPRDTEVEEES